MGRGDAKNVPRTAAGAEPVKGDLSSVVRFLHDCRHDDVSWISAVVAVGSQQFPVALQATAVEMLNKIKKSVRTSPNL